MSYEISRDYFAPVEDVPENDEHVLKRALGIRIILVSVIKSVAEIQRKEYAKNEVKQVHRAK